MSRNPHISRRPTAPPRPRKIIIDQEGFHSQKAPEPDEPHGLIMWLTVLLVMALMFSGIAWLIVFIWIDILSMM